LRDRLDDGVGATDMVHRPMLGAAILVAYAGVGYGLGGVSRLGHDVRGMQFFERAWRVQADWPH